MVPKWSHVVPTRSLRTRTRRAHGGGSALWAGDSDVVVDTFWAARHSPPSHAHGLVAFAAGITRLRQSTTSVA